MSSDNDPDNPWVCQRFDALFIPLPLYSLAWSSDRIEQAVAKSLTSLSTFSTDYQDPDFDNS